MTKQLIITAIALTLSTITCSAQGTLDDYNRAYELRSKYSRRNMFYSNMNPRWQQGKDAHTFWYVRNTPKGDAIVTVNADKKKVTIISDSAEVAKRLKAERDAMYHPTGPQRHWMEVDDEKGRNPVPSPDGSQTAYIKDCNLYVKDNVTGRETRLSIDGTLGAYYSNRIAWSPDGKYVTTCRIKPVAEKRYVYYVESSPSDQLQPKLHKQEYAKPGDELMQKLPCIFSIDGKRSIIPDNTLFANQYELYGPEWAQDSKKIIFEYNQRGHQVYRVLELNAETGKVRTLIEEKSDKYVAYIRNYRYSLKDGKHMIWMSERSGWGHLYMADVSDDVQSSNTNLQPITQGEWYVRQVLNVDEDNKQIYFTANGMYKDQDPYLIYYYKVNFDGTGLTCLTPEFGTHQAWFSEDMKLLIDQYSTIDNPPVTVLRSSVDGRILMTLDKADISSLTANGWKAPEQFAAPGRDGKTPMYGVIYRPSNFDPEKKYPIIEYIYQGPGDQYVQKQFRTYDWDMSSLAELGFVVVMVDGMGTSWRSRAFEDICWKNLVDAGIPDHIAWIKAAATKYPYMDIERVGIFGCSAGGQESTSALLLHPEFYKCAYSACGCHDNRMDKIWWNEQWLGYPIGDQYKAGSNVENAHLLQHPLMLCVGELDDNVDPASTMQVVNALEKAGKDFELIVIPGAHHTMGEDFGEHKRYDFFVKNLLHVWPPKWSDIKH